MKDAILVDINRKENLFNMRKNINKIVGLTLCIGMLTGCAQTPESSLVKPKGNKAEDAYTEAEGVDIVKEDSSENTKDKNTAVRTTIRDLLNAPETYKSQTTDDSAKLVVNTDATVEIPDVEKISAISVTPAEVTQDLLDRITDAFFSEAKLYTSDSYYTQTKDEIKKTLDELKEDVANGNLDPYNYGTDEDGNYIYDIYGEIEMYEQEYEAAPEKKTLVEGNLLQAPRRQKMVLRKMTSPVLHRCRMERNIFTRHLPTDPIPYLSKSEKRQNLAGKSCLWTRPGLSILLPVKEKNLLRSPLGFH